MTDQPTKLQHFWREWLKPVLVVVVVVATFRSSFADWNDVPTGSMRPTILEGDRVFLNKVAYDLRVPFVGWRIAPLADPARGDIVIFPSPKDGVRLIKRVVGVPGDTIEVDGGCVIVNGKRLDYSESSSESLNGVEREAIVGADLMTEKLGEVDHFVLIHRFGLHFGSFPAHTLGSDEYFMMGDNRDQSQDSRFFGAVKREAILGKALAVALSGDPESYYKPRFSRFFSALH